MQINVNNVEQSWSLIIYIYTYILFPAILYITLYTVSGFKWTKSHSLSIRVHLCTFWPSLRSSLSTVWVLTRRLRQSLVHRKLFVTCWLRVHTVSEASPAVIAINHLFKRPHNMNLCHLLHDLHNCCCKGRTLSQTDRRRGERCN